MRKSQRNIGFFVTSLVVGPDPKYGEESPSCRIFGVIFCRSGYQKCLRVRRPPPSKHLQFMLSIIQFPELPVSRLILECACSMQRARAIIQIARFRSYRTNNLFLLLAVVVHVERMPRVPLQFRYVKVGAHITGSVSVGTVPRIRVRFMAVPFVSRV